MVTVTAKTGAVLTVTRGSLGTTPAAYTAGTEAKEAKYRSYNALGKQIIVDALKQIVVNSAGLNAPIIAATATKDATVEAAVQ